ncbi:MAG: BrnT family toxin [Desulfamplus sp.]|nr:BrnT family toxin [Desulfamplus sp.]
MNLIFEWNENKESLNLRKHKVSFEEAKTVFNDPMLVTFLDEHHSDYEERLISIGMSSNSRILLVVHTEQESDGDTILIRIISCRKVTKHERRTYQEN